MQNKRTALAGLLSMLLAAPALQAQPVSEEAAIQLLQRVNELEQELRNLRGENETLNNELSTLRQNQKDGFLQVDERIERLQQPDASTNTAPNPATPATTNPASTAITNRSTASTNATATSSNTAATTEQQDKNSSTEKAADKPQPDKSDPAGYYSYGNGKVDDKNILNKADKNTATATTDKPAEAEKTDKTTTTPPATSTPADKEKVAENSNTSSSTPATTRPNTTVPASGNDARSSYDHAFQTLLQDPKESIAEFRTFLKEYPNSSLAPSAQYWIGEAYYAERNFKAAVDEFLIVLKEFKSSPKASDAALKLGYSFYELKEWDKARQTLQDVINFFPDNQETSKLARQRLDKMQAEGH